MLRVAVAFDHAGFPLREQVLKCVREAGCESLDMGASEYISTDDYPDYARRAGEAIQDGLADRAIIVCGSGVGASIAASKINGVRAAVCHDTYSARQGVTHDDLNALCLGGRVIGVELVNELIEAFLSAEFSGDERHVRRLDKIREIEAGNLAPTPD